MLDTWKSGILTQPIDLFQRVNETLPPCRSSGPLGVARLLVVHDTDSLNKAYIVRDKFFHLVVLYQPGNACITD